MNLVDMLSSESNGQYEATMYSILNQEGSEQLPNITQPPGGVYYLPTVLTNLQKDLMEYIVNIFSPELIKGIQDQLEKTKIHNLLDDDDTREDDDSLERNDSGLTYQEIISLLFKQLKVTTNHPSLLVDHFLSKKLLLLETNERLTNMSSKFQLFNRLVDSLINEFNNNVKFEKAPVYNILVVADSVKELELIEGLIIGKNVHYNNVSTVKLYGENHLVLSVINPPEPQPDDIENEYKRKRNTKTPKPKKSPILFLHLTTAVQLYNNYSPLLNNSLEFKLIFTFDINLDIKCPSIEMIRSNKDPQIPIIVPIPLYSVDHLQMITGPPETNPMFSENNEMYNWKKLIIHSFVLNRINLVDDDMRIDDFFVKYYGHNMNTLMKWFLGWDLIEFPIPDIFEEFNDKLLSYNEDKLIKRLEISYKEETIEKLDVFDYESFKAKFTDLLNKRVEIVTHKMTDLQGEIDTYRFSETKRQLEFDRDEELIAENYRKLRRLNEDASFVENKYSRVQHELTTLDEEKIKLQEKLEILKTLKQANYLEKLEDQNKQIDELQFDNVNITTEYNKIIEDHETMKKQYQESSTEALQLSIQIKTWQAKNQKIENKTNGPGIKILPSLMKKDDLINHEMVLKKLQKSNEFFENFYNVKLEKVIKERNTMIDNSSGSSSRSISRISRGATPM